MATAQDDGGSGGPRDATWRLVAHKPLLYHCSDFLSSAECDALLQLATSKGLEVHGQKRCAELDAGDPGVAAADAALLHRVDQRITALTGLRPHADELPWAVHVTPPSQEISLRTYDGRLVAARLRDDGRLYAMAAKSPEPATDFLMVDNEDGTISLKSGHGKYVVAKDNGSVKANRASIGEWEKFRVLRHDDGTVSFQSHHGTCLAVEPSGTVRATTTPQASSRFAVEGGGSSGRSLLTLGLHVDTNNSRDRRWMTFIAYLTTPSPADGGHTVFPLALPPGGAARTAEQQGLLAAGQRLLDAGMQHTGRPEATEMPWRPESSVGDVRALLRHADAVARCARAASEPCNRGLAWDPSGLGLAVPAQRGSCVAFFTRSTRVEGAIDPHSWHGGAGVFGGGSELHSAAPGSPPEGKWTLQKFREAPRDWAGGRIDGAAAAAFVAQHAVLRPCCAGGIRFDVV